MEIKLTEEGKKERKYFGDSITVIWSILKMEFVLLVFRVAVVAVVGWAVGQFTLAMLLLFILDFRELFTGRYK